MPRRDRSRRPRRRAFWLAWGTCALLATAWGCSGWDPLDPFQHDSPQVDDAIKQLDAGKNESAEEILERYLATGQCINGDMGLSDLVRQRSNGSFDLGLTLFKLAEKFGRRFGDEDGQQDEGLGVDPEGARRPVAPERSADTECARVIVKAIAEDVHVPPELRARAYYLLGNLEFLNGKYEDAVKQYDLALAITPGLPADAGFDAIGRDAANNRAIALRRLEKQQQQDGGQSDASQDGGGGDGGDAGDSGSGQDDASTDGGQGDAGGDGGDDDDKKDDQNQGPDAGDAGQDAGPDASPDGGGDAGQDAGIPADQGDAGAQPQQQKPPGDDQAKGANQDDRMLDHLEDAPTYQQQDARQRANQRRPRSMEDK